MMLYILSRIAMVALMSVLGMVVFAAVIIGSTWLILEVLKSHVGQ